MRVGVRKNEMEEGARPGPSPLWGPLKSSNFGAQFARVCLGLEAQILRVVALHPTSRLLPMLVFLWLSLVT